MVSYQRFGTVIKSGQIDTLSIQPIITNVTAGKAAILVRLFGHGVFSLLKKRW
jgi:hypothetical protein